MSLKAAAGVAGDLGVRFNLMGLLPTAVLATMVGALIASGAPDDRPELDVLLHRLDELSTSDAGLLAAGLLVAALILQPLQLPLVRLLEGYWGDGPIGRRAAAAGLARQRARRQRLAEAATPAPSGERDEGALVQAAWQLRHRFPPEARLLPTALGNALRAAEYRAGRPYGLDAVVMWPRLYPLLSEQVRGSVDDLRLQMDLLARFTAVFVAGALATAALLAAHGWWLAVPMANLAVAAVCYRGCVAAAGGYGVAVEVAFDLTHLELRDALHLERPANRTTEKRENEGVTELFRGIPNELRYKA